MRIAWVHEYRQRRKIKRILEENRKHPERVLSLSQIVANAHVPQGDGSVSFADLQAIHQRIIEKSTEKD